MSLPQISADTILNWSQPISLVKVTRNKNSDLNIITTTTTVEFEGVISHIKPAELMLKQESYREFPWIKIYCVPGDISLKTNDIIVFNGIEYKIMLYKPYNEYGFVQYEAMQNIT